MKPQEFHCCSEAVCVLCGRTDEPKSYKCHGCGKNISTDTVIWALSDGTLNTDTGYPYCDKCVPEAIRVHSGSKEPRIYRIVRFRYRGGRPRTIRNNVTLSEAQDHCSNPKTRREGVWFDGYDYMPGCSPDGR